MANYDSGVRWDSGWRYDEPGPTRIRPTHMIDLHKFLMNPFDDAGISLAELLAFTTDHLQRLTANDLGHTYVPRIAATTAALNAVDSAFADDESKLALRKARKLVKNDYRDALPKRIGRIAVAVEAAFGEQSAEFVECFPRGRKIFTDCPDDQLSGYLQTLIAGATGHAAQLGAPLVADATALLSGWNAVYAPSETATGNKTSTQEARTAARAALQLELFKNLLTLALDFPRQPAQLDVFMRQDLLQDHPRQKTAPTPAPSPVPVP